jgi:DNA polymerase-3 subunit alpha
MARFAKKSLAELISDAASVECKVAGIVTDMRTRRTKKGDLMAIFILEDMTGAVETVVFPRDYPRFEQILTADTPVLVSGRFESEEEKSCKIIASDIQPLSGLAERNARGLFIHAAVERLSPDTAMELYRLLEKNRGETGVNLELYHPRDFRVTIQSADFVKVKSSPDLIRQIERICGAGSVELIA